MNEAANNRPPRSFYWVSGAALVWNLVGMMSYIAQVTMSPDALAALPEAQRALYANIPTWATSAYAIAVTAGVIGSLLLILRKAWAVPVFAISLLAVLVQMYHAFFMTSMLEVMGPTSAILPALVIVIGGLLIWYSNSAKSKGFIS